MQKKREIKARLPAELKASIQQLSGICMDDVWVHYYSCKPASLHAYAFAHGTHIYMAPGQERWLPHEAWHVVQQKQGRVQPTRQIENGTWINDDIALETEADIFGNLASEGHFAILPACVLVRKINVDTQSANGIVQRQVIRDGEFSQNGDHYNDYAYFRVILPDAIYNDLLTDLIITSRDYAGRKYGNTKCKILYRHRWYDMDKNAAWESAPHYTQAQIIIRIYHAFNDILSREQVIETLAHEWKFHGEQFYTFINHHLRDRNITSNQLRRRYDDRNDGGYLDVEEQHALLFENRYTTDMDKSIAQIGRQIHEGDATRLYQEYQTDVRDHDMHNRGHVPSLTHLFGLE